MKNTTKKITLGLTILVTVFALTTAYKPVNAADTTPSTFEQTPQGRGLVVTPDVIYLRGDRGQTLNSKYSITNDNIATASVTVYPRTANFIQNKDGSPVEDTQPRSIDSDFAKWVQLSSAQVTVQQKEIKPLNFTVQIPSTAPFGTYYGLLILSKVDPKAPQTQTTASNTFAVDQVEIPMILTVGDITNIKENADIADMYTSDYSGSKETSFYASNPQIHISITNTGNSYVIPQGDVFIYKTDKTNPTESLPFNKNGLIVQQGNVRDYVINESVNGFINDSVNSWFTMDKYNFSRFFDFKIGTYNATYDALITPPKELNSTSNFIVKERSISYFAFPVQIIVLVFLILIIILGIVGYKFRNKIMPMIMMSKKGKIQQKKLK